MDVAPQGMTNVQATLCGSCAVEGTFKFAFKGRGAQMRGGSHVEPSEEDLSSCLAN